MNDQAFIALRQENDRLVAENSELRRQLRHDPEPSFVDIVTKAFGIMPSTARVLWVLWDCKVRTHDQIFHALYGDRLDQPEIKIVQVQICKLRAAIKGADALIETLWGKGYQLPKADRAKIAAHIGIEVQP